MRAWASAEVLSEREMRALDIWHEVLQSAPERGIREETERGLLRVIERARADILG